MPGKRLRGTGKAEATWRGKGREASKFRRGASVTRSGAVIIGRRAADTGPELKFHDKDVDQAAADLSGGIILTSGTLNNIDQGIDEHQRIGRKVVIKSIGWRGTLKLAAFAGATMQAPITVRLMLVLDRQCNKALPTVAGVLETADYQSFNNLANKNRYHVISDQVFDMNPVCGGGNGTANDTSGVDQSFTVFKRTDIPIEFSGASGAIGTTNSNNLFVLIIDSVSASSLTLDSKMRLRFADG